jgi:hypothetical protein
MTFSVNQKSVRVGCFQPYAEPTRCGLRNRYSIGCRMRNRKQVNGAGQMPFARKAVAWMMLAFTAPMAAVVQARDEPLKRSSVLALAE